jgi:ElaB/YqjD/DUF883 family membrane-anchored ribosome-binding protein
MSTTTGTKEALKGLKSQGQELMEQFNDASEQLGRFADRAVRDSKRTFREFQDAAEDTYEETKQRIRREPVRSVAVAAGIGVAVGLLIGYMLRSRDRD